MTTWPPLKQLSSDAATTQFISDYVAGALNARLASFPPRSASAPP
jgi:hypothetical protein